MFLRRYSYLAQDPELKFVGQGGTALCQFSIGHTRNIKRGDGWEKEVSYVAIKSWGTTAERASELHKGAEVICSGRLVQEKWTTADGSQRSRIVLIADKVDPVWPPKAAPAKDTRSQTDDDLPF